MDPNFSKSDYRGQNPLHWWFIYIIGNFFERRCLKWTRMTHLETSNTSYGQMKGWESRLVKVKNRPNSLVFRWRATYHWKALNEGYNFAWNLIVIGSLHAKLWAPKIKGVLVVRISRLPLGSPKTKCHLGVGPVAKHKVYYKGEGGGLPPSLGRGESYESDFAYDLS